MQVCLGAGGWFQSRNLQSRCTHAASADIANLENNAEPEKPASRSDAQNVGHRQCSVPEQGLTQALGGGFRHSWLLPMPPRIQRAARTPIRQ